MTNYYTYPLSGDINDMNAYSHVITVKAIDCTPTCTSTILSGCNDLWNCKGQSTSSFYNNPVLAGDKFMFQTKFIDRYNADEENPVSGWGSFVIAELLDGDGNELSTDHTEFASRYLVGWNGSESYQLIEINFDLIKTNFPEITCFSFKFVAYNDEEAETDSVCSQHFKEYDNTCKDTILVKSITSSDCCGNYYGSPETYQQFVGNANFKYNNQWRYHASIRQTNTEFEKTSFGTKRTRVDLDKIFTFQLKKPIPPYLFKQLAETHFSGEQVFVGGQEYYIDSFSFPNESERKMFIGKIQLFQKCDTDFRCG